MSGVAPASSPPALTLRSASPEATEALARPLAAELRSGDVIVLSGPLGAGKTRFVAGLAAGLDAASRVRSPSFTLVHEYRGRVTLVHLDLYRLETADLDGLGLEELLERGALAAEWGEKLPAALREEALAILIEPGRGDERTLEVSGSRGRGAELLQSWRARLVPGTAGA